MGERLPKLVAAVAVVLGVAAVLAGASVFLDALRASQVWAGSSEAQQAAFPSEEPIWLDEPAPQHAVVPQAALPQAAAPPPIATQAMLRAPDRDEISVTARASAPDAPTLADPPTSTAAEPALSDVDLATVELVEVDFRFLDPPEPGAHARLALSLVNHASMPTGPLSVAVPNRWLQSFSVFGAIPGVLDDRARGDDERQFVFGGLAPGERQTLELHVLSTAEEVEAPELRLLLGDDAEIGRVRPRTVAPRPRPGPARAVSIPKLGVRASVVPVAWEPPPFVVGEVQGSAAVSLGNTVLIGHLAGPWGDVFARLDRLRLGDEVVAVSRGLEYRYVVSEIAARPSDDVMPTQPTATPRLTLMTCTGQWSITRQDYSHRLWVVAEPPELAQQTIRANAERAAQAAREAEVAAAARATHEAEMAEGVGMVATPTPPETDASPTAVAEVLAAPLAVAAPEGAPEEAENLAPGITIDVPVDKAAVARRLSVRGRRAVEADTQAPLWLLVRAEIAGSRWYALDRALEPDKDGNWQVDVELGGPAGIRHEIRVGVADATADAALRRRALERSGQPLDEVPEGFKTGARVVVERAR